MASFHSVSALDCFPQFFRGDQELMISSLLPLNETASCTSTMLSLGDQQNYSRQP